MRQGRRTFWGKSIFQRMDGIGCRFATSSEAPATTEEIDIA
jgi:hypothetical protein